MIWIAEENEPHPYSSSAPPGEHQLEIENPGMASLEEGPVHGKSDSLVQGGKPDEGPVGESVSPAGKPEEGPVREGDSLVQAEKPEEGPVGESDSLVQAEKPEEGPVGESDSLVQVGKPEGMSKRQWKKLLKQETREKMKPEWKKRSREREKEKRKKRKLEGLPAAPFCKKRKMSDKEASPIRVAIELGYEHLMDDRDIKMLMKQCQRCYAANRRSTAPLQLFLTNFGGRLKERMESVHQYHHWDVHFRSGSYIEEFGKENVVFLAAESPNIITDLDYRKVYVIGGLVDHNHHKGYCFKAAVENGVAHAQLPISEYVKLNSRKVLTVNHVFEVLLQFVQYNDWKKAFYDAIPQRKLADCQMSAESSSSSLDSTSAQLLTSDTANIATHTTSSQTVCDTSFIADTEVHAGPPLQDDCISTPSTAVISSLPSTHTDDCHIACSRTDPVTRSNDAPTDTVTSNNAPTDTVTSNNAPTEKDSSQEQDDCSSISISGTPATEFTAGSSIKDVTVIADTVTKLHGRAVDTD